MTRFLALLLLLAVLPLVLRADDDTKQIQQALKSQGFYYGDVNGAPSEETTQAIRRFQIRNALPVTGKLDDETRQAIAAGGAASAPPSAPAPEPPRISGVPSTPQVLPPANPLPDAAARPPSAARPDLRADPAQPPANPRFPASSIPDAPVIEGTVTYRGGSTIFNGGPFAGAPPFVQSSVIGQAQALLAREGFYKGAADGLPSQRFAEALLAYQSAYGLPHTGRLDANTVGALGIAPVGAGSTQRRGNPANPRVYEPRQTAPGVYEGRIVPETAPR